MRFHISKNGEIAECKAKQNKCPLEHFPSFKEAEAHLEEQSKVKKFIEKYSQDFKYNEEDVDYIYRAEPAITANLMSLENSDIKLTNLEYRLKTKESIKEKIEARKECKSVNELNDIVRYTFITDEENYTSNMNKTISSILSKDGYNVIQIKNTWSTPGYKGVNCKFQKDDVKFEVQFHTKASLEAKEAVHPIYQKARLLNENSKEYQKYAKQMEHIFSLVPPVK